MHPTPTPTPRRATAAASLAFLLASIAFGGCGAGKPAPRYASYPVRGQVLFQGKPLAGALVTFHPVEESRFSQDIPRPTGHTDDDGKFRLTTTTTGDGAPAGPYLVAISGLARPPSEGSVLPDPNKPLAKADITKGRYLDPKKSGLKADVKEGENELPPFELK
jgi:hypothetical protein